MSKTLLSVADLRNEFGWGRDLSTRIMRLLPHIKMGHCGRGEKLQVKRADLENFVNRAASEKADLWQLAKHHTPESLQKWLNSFRETN